VRVFVRWLDFEVEVEDGGKEMVGVEVRKGCAPLLSRMQVCSRYDSCCNMIDTGSLASNHV